MFLIILLATHFAPIPGGVPVRTARRRTRRARESQRIILSVGSILWFTSDLVENGIVYFLLSTYPTRLAVPATVLAYVSVSEFYLLLVAFVLTLAAPAT